jgi:hypothetical protein
MYVLVSTHNNSTEEKTVLLLQCQQQPGGARMTPDSLATWFHTMRTRHWYVRLLIFINVYFAHYWYLPLCMTIGLREPLIEIS